MVSDARWAGTFPMAIRRGNKALRCLNPTAAGGEGQGQIPAKVEQSTACSSTMGRFAGPRKGYRLGCRRRAGRKVSPVGGGSPNAHGGLSNRVTVVADRRTLRCPRPAGQASVAQRDSSRSAAGAGPDRQSRAQAHRFCGGPSRRTGQTASPRGGSRRVRLRGRTTSTARWRATARALDGAGSARAARQHGSGGSPSGVQAARWLGRFRTYGHRSGHWTWRATSRSIPSGVERFCTFGCSALSRVDDTARFGGHASWEGGQARGCPELCFRHAGDTAGASQHLGAKPRPRQDDCASMPA